MTTLRRLKIVSQDRPARSKEAVCFCSDGQYLPYATFAAWQLATLHPERSFDILVASDKALPSLPLLEQNNIRLLQIDIGTEFEGLRLDARRTEAVYLRLALPELLAADYDRLLYMDSDVYVARDGVSELLTSNMRDRAVAAVRDNTQWRSPARLPEQYRRFNWPTAPYFNSGVLLIDIPKFREAKLMQSCIAFGRKHKDILIGHDQTLLNCVLEGQWAEMSPRWNWQFTWASWIYALSEDARIFHFIGPNKPWSDRSGRFPQFITRQYRDFLSEYFPESARDASSRSPLGDGRKLTKSLAKHGLSRSKMKAYLDRFPDDITLVDPI